MEPSTKTYQNLTGTYIKLLNVAEILEDFSVKINNQIHRPPVFIIQNISNKDLFLQKYISFPILCLKKNIYMLFTSLLKRMLNFSRRLKIKLSVYINVICPAIENSFLSKKRKKDIFKVYCN